MDIIVPKNYEQYLQTSTDQDLARIGHINRLIEAYNVIANSYPTKELLVSASTTIDASSNFFQNLHAASSLTAISFYYSNIIDGSTVTIDYEKTTASPTILTFPSGTVVSISSGATVSLDGLSATLTSTASGRFSITILRFKNVYKVFIVQDVA